MPVESSTSSPVSRWKIILALGTIYIVWGSTFLAIRVGVQSMPPFFLAASRFLCAGVLLYLWGLFTTRERPTKRHWVNASIIGLLLLVSGNGVVVWVAQRLPSGLTALIISTVPLWMVCLPAFFSRNQRPRARTVVGLALGLGGVSILIPPPEGNFWSGASGDCVLLVLASLSWAIGTLFSKRAELPRSGALSAGMEMMTGGLQLALLSALTGEWEGVHIRHISTAAWIGLAYLIIFGSVIAFSAYRWLTPRISTARLATYAYVNPVVAVLLGRVFLAEPLSSRLVIGAIVILSGVVLISLPHPRPTLKTPDTAAV